MEEKIVSFLFRYRSDNLYNQQQELAFRSLITLSVFIATSSRNGGKNCLLGNKVAVKISF